MRIAKTIVVFVALGPLLAWLLFVAALAVQDPIIRVMAPLMALVGILPNYVFGGIPALLTGAIVGVAQDRWPSFGFIHVMALGLVGGAVFALIVAKVEPPVDAPTDLTAYVQSRFFVVSILLFLIPTLICWLIARRWRRLA
jgi:hypothetical protein